MASAMDSMMTTITIVVVALSAFGFAFTEGDEEGEGDFMYKVNIEQGHPAEQREYDYDDGESQSYTFEVGINTIKIEFELSWFDDVPSTLGGGPNDDFTIEVTPPAGVPSEDYTVTPDLEVSGTDSPLTIIVRFIEDDEIPKDDLYDGESEEDVKDALSHSKGSGTWTITVTLTDAGPSQPLYDDDAGNNARTKWTIHFYEITSIETIATE